MTTADVGKARDAFLSWLDHSKCHLIPVAAIFDRCCKELSQGVGVKVGDRPTQIFLG